MEKKVRLAVVGIGRISTAHIQAILNTSDQAELAALVSRNEQRVKEEAKRLGVKKVYTDYETMLRDPEIDGVVLCTPNPEHYHQTILAARYGKHILVEKPMAMSVDEAIEMEHAARTANVKLMVAHCRRFFQAIDVAKEKLSEIGPIIDMTHYLGVQFERNLTDWWADMKHWIIELNAPHPLDTTIYLLEELPQTVYAVGGSYSDQIPGTSQATIVMTFGSGKTASVILSFHCKPGVNERIIIGTKGTMRIRDEKDLWITGQPVVSEKYGSYLQGGVNFDRQMKEFCTAIQQEREPLASGREIVGLMRILDAVKRSLDEHRVVSMSEIPSSFSVQRYEK